MANDRNQNDRSQADRTQNDRTQDDRTQTDRTQRDQNQRGREGGLEGSPGSIDRDQPGLTGKTAGAGKRDRIGNADVPDSTQIPWNAERGEPDYEASGGAQQGNQRDDLDSPDRDQNRR